MDFLSTYLILASVYALVAISTNLLIGVTGIFSVSQAAVFGVGAYTVGGLTLNGVVNYPVALLIAICLSMLVNVAFALPALRVKGDYFVVASFGIQLVASAVFENWTGVTGGTIGMLGIPMPEFLGFTARDTTDILVLTLVVLLLASGVYLAMMRAAFGQLLLAIRENEEAVAAAGKSVIRTKVMAAGVAGAFAALAGGLYAPFISFIDPHSFDLHTSILVVAMVAVGGMRTLSGSILGAFVLMGLPQLLTFIDIPSSLGGPLRQLMYGVLLVAFMMFRPQGLAGRSFSETREAR